MVAVAHLVRASPCGGEGRRFKSAQPPLIYFDIHIYSIFTIFQADSRLIGLYTSIDKM